MISEMFTGARYALRGLQLMTAPGVKRFVIGPALINIAVFATLGFLGIHWFDRLLDAMLPAAEGFWSGLARAFLWVLFGAAAAVAMFFSFSVVANLIGSPFNGKLAARVRERLAPGLGAGAAGPGWFASFAGELRKLLYFLILMLLGFLMTFVPIVNLLVPLVWILIGAWLLALEYLAYPMENDGMGFSAVRRRLARSRATALGFGMVVMLGTLVPIVNFFIMPAAVAGASALWVERLRAEERL